MYIRPVEARSHTERYSHPPKPDGSTRTQHEHSTRKQEITYHDTAYLGLLSSKTAQCTRMETKLLLTSRLFQMLERTLQHGTCPMRQSNLINRMMGDFLVVIDSCQLERVARNG